jgi:hypothetical protein
MVSLGFAWEEKLRVIYASGADVVINERINRR